MDSCLTFQVASDTTCSPSVTVGTNVHHEIDDGNSSTTPIPSRRHPDEILGHNGNISDLDGTLKASAPGIPHARQPPMGAASCQSKLNGCLTTEDQINRDSETNLMPSSPSNNVTCRQNQQPRLGVQSTLLANRPADRLQSPTDMIRKTVVDNEDRKLLQTKIVQQPNGNNSPQMSRCSVATRAEKSE